LTAQELSLSVGLVARRGGWLCRGALGIALAFVATQALGSGQAWAQTSTPATVSRVIDGDTLVARLADSSEVTVRLIGIDTPETVKPRCSS
jgi:micrococcal nuclease